MLQKAEELQLLEVDTLDVYMIFNALLKPK